MKEGVDPPKLGWGMPFPPGVPNETLFPPPAPKLKDGVKDWEKS